MIDMLVLPIGTFLVTYLARNPYFEENVRKAAVGIGIGLAIVYIVIRIVF